MSVLCNVMLYYITLYIESGYIAAEPELQAVATRINKLSLDDVRNISAYTATSLEDQKNV